MTQREIDIGEVEAALRFMHQDRMDMVVWSSLRAAISRLERGALGADGEEHS